MLTVSSLTKAAVAHESTQSWASAVNGYSGDFTIQVYPSSHLSCREFRLLGFRTCKNGLSCVLAIPMPMHFPSKLPKWTRVIRTDAAQCVPHWRMEVEWMGLLNEHHWNRQPCSVIEMEFPSRDFLLPPRHSFYSSPWRCDVSQGVSGWTDSEVSSLKYHLITGLYVLQRSRVTHVSWSSCSSAFSLSSFSSSCSFYASSPTLHNPHSAVLYLRPSLSLNLSCSGGLSSLILSDQNPRCPPPPRRKLHYRKEGGREQKGGEIYVNVARFARNAKRVSEATLGSSAEDAIVALSLSPALIQLPQFTPAPISWQTGREELVKFDRLRIMNYASSELLCPAGWNHFYFDESLLCYLHLFSSITFLPHMEFLFVSLCVFFYMCVRVRV